MSKGISVVDLIFRLREEEDKGNEFLTLKQLEEIYFTLLDDKSTLIEEIDEI